MTRNDIQRYAASCLATDGRLICKWCTGVGKSGVAIKFIKNFLGIKCLIVVPEKDNIDNWCEEFRKFETSLDNVTIICYASLHKYVNTQWDLIVFDEVPHVDTPLKKSICETITADYVLALGAVVTDEEIQTLESCYGRFIISELPIDRAIELGFLPPPTVYIVHCYLENEKKTCYYKQRKVSPRHKYEMMNQEIEAAKNAYEKNPSSYNRQVLNTLGLNRKRFLGRQKDEIIKWICDNLDKKGRRYICFCSSIKQATELGGIERAYTSKSPKSQKHLEKFNNHEINALFVVGKLIEGQNLNDIECGVLGQLGGTERITVQSIGRVLRSKNPVVYIPVFDNTKDESFLYNVKVNIPTNYIKHYNNKSFI